MAQWARSLMGSPSAHRESDILTVNPIIAHSLNMKPQSALFTPAHHLSHQLLRIRASVIFARAPL